MSLEVLTQVGGTGGASASIFVTGLDENSVVKATHKVPLKLPSGYTSLSYIESTGEQYLDTGIKPNNNTGVEIKLRHSVSSGDNFFFGSGAGWTYAALALGVAGISFGSKAAYYRVPTDVDVEAVLDNGVLSYNTGATLSPEANTFQSNYNAYLFGTNFGNGPQYFVGKIYYCKVYDNETLIRDYVPCVNPDGVVGMYDFVGKRFYDNAGTGTFIAGEEIQRYVDKTVNGEWNGAESRFEINKIKEYGMYTVTATNGKDTTTQDVLVDAAVEYEIPMRYWNGELYEEGNEFEDITGGWGILWGSQGSVSTVTFVKNEDNIYIASSNGGYYNEGGTAPNDMIDFTPHSALKMRFKQNTSGSWIALGRGPARIIDDKVTYVWTNATSATELSMDISDVTGAFYVLCFVGKNNSCTIEKVWLE